MACLFLAGTLTTIFVIFTGADKTLGEANPVTSRISLMISFILSAYITITVNRWDRIRNGTLGKDFNYSCSQCVYTYFSFLSHLISSYMPFLMK